jgi:hypothetical protein
VEPAQKKSGENYSPPFAKNNEIGSLLLRSFFLLRIALLAGLLVLRGFHAAFMAAFLACFLGVITAACLQVRSA